MVFDALADAIRRESNQAVCHWFGVTAQTVSRWRNLLGEKTTPGTSRLRREYCFEPVSESHLARGTRPPRAGRPWTAAEDEAVRTMTPWKAAIACKRTLSAVNHRRHELMIKPGERPQ